MATLVMPNEALLNWADAQVDDLPTLSDMRVRLIESAVTIDQATTASELLEAEATYAGYDPVELGEWTAPVIIDGEAMTEPEVITFGNTSGATVSVYGAFGTSLTGDKLWWVSSLGGLIHVPHGSELQIDLSILLATIFNN